MNQSTNVNNADEPIVHGVASQCHCAKVRICTSTNDPYCTECGKYCNTFKPTPDADYDVWKLVNSEVPIDELT